MLHLSNGEDRTDERDEYVANSEETIFIEFQ